MDDLRSLIYRDSDATRENLLEPFYMSMSESKDLHDWPPIEELLKKEQYSEGSSSYFTEKIIEEIGKEYSPSYKMLLLVESLIAVRIDTFFKKSNYKQLFNHFGSILLFLLAHMDQTFPQSFKF